MRGREDTKQIQWSAGKTLPHALATNTDLLSLPEFSASVRPLPKANEYPRIQNPRAPMAQSMRFLNRMLLVFFGLTLPASRMANPACIPGDMQMIRTNTRTAHVRMNIIFVELESAATVLEATSSIGAEPMLEMTPEFTHTCWNDPEPVGEKDA
eukprot:1034516-Amorphochlora_amoeboformis.AAC.2